VGFVGLRVFASGWGVFSWFAVYQVATICAGGGGGLVSCPCWPDMLREVVVLGGYCMPLSYLLGVLGYVWREVVPLGGVAWSVVLLPIGGLCVAGRCGVRAYKGLGLHFLMLISVIWLIFICFCAFYGPLLSFICFCISEKVKFL
jgi:hypothetical protein